MDTIEVEREVFDALIERVDFLHKTVKALYDELRDKKLSDWLNTKQTCDYLSFPLSAVSSSWRSQTCCAYLPYPHIWCGPASLRRFAWF